MWLLWFTCLLINVSFYGKKSFVIHLEFFRNMHRHMIGLKELTLVNEKIKHLGYKASKYIKANPCVHPN
jgi:hypothetical protein